MRIGDEDFACEFQGRNRLFVSYGWKFFEKYFKAVASLQIVEQDFDRDASSHEDGGTTQNFGITMHHQLSIKHGPLRSRMIA